MTNDAAHRDQPDADDGRRHRVRLLERGIQARET